MSENVTSRGISRFLPLAAGAAVLIGIVCLIVGFWPQPMSFGWSAYVPLSNTVYLQDGAQVFTRTAQVGVVLLVAGLVALAFWCGLEVGRRGGAAPTNPDATA
jgi:heme/copper-type cytochrome/quinol oxidase subunit 1